MVPVTCYLCQGTFGRVANFAILGEIFLPDFPLSIGTPGAEQLVIERSFIARLFFAAFERSKNLGPNLLWLLWQFGGFFLATLEIAAASLARFFLSAFQWIPSDIIPSSSQQ